MKIGGIYYYRRRVPCFLQSLTGKAFVKLSLKTSDKEHAELRALKFDNLLEELAFELRLQLLEPQQAIEQLKLAGVFGNETQPLVTKPARKVMVKTNKSKMLEPVSILFQRYKQERLASGRWIEKTSLENQRCFDLLVSAVGDHNPEYYTHMILLDFRNDVLQKLPPNANTSPRTKGKSLSTILKMQHGRVLSLSQVNKYMVCISAFFSYLHQHEFVSQNPAHHLLLSRAKTRPDEERLAFSVETIKFMLKELSQQRDSFGSKQGRFWIPRIAAFSGMRLTECCQLYLDDLRQQDGIWRFDINDKNDKRVKTASSVRIVPIHPSLISDGLLEYADSIRLTGHERLFPELHCEKYHGYGRAMSKWFSYFNRRFLSDNPRLVFHSLRHSFASNLHDQGVEQEIIMQIMGHHDVSVSARYCKRAKLSVLLSAVIKLPW